MCVRLPFVIPHVRYVHFDLHIGISLKGRTTHIWSFGYGFAYSTTMGCAAFKPLFGIIIVL